MVSSARMLEVATRWWVTSTACVMLGGCGGGERPAVASGSVVSAGMVADWREIATEHDRARLRGWRAAWVAALREARAGSEQVAVAADRALFDPDGAIADAALPTGDYRCRTFKLGNHVGGTGFLAYPWFACRVSGDRLAKIDGSQRPVGRILADTGTRSVFLGTLVLGDEKRAIDYGRDASRDVAGLIERIGPARWRLVLPYPRFESTLDVIELVPVRTAGKVSAAER